MKAYRMRMLACFLAVLVFIPRSVPAESGEGLEARLGALETLVTEQQKVIALLREKLSSVEKNPALTLGQYLKYGDKEMKGMTGPHVIIEGVNLHLRSGSGFTNDRDGKGMWASKFLGLGNFVIGYNEHPYSNFTLRDGDRRGSHNLVMGFGNRFFGFASIVHGWENTVGGGHAAAISGDSNLVPASFSAAVGGWHNETSGSGSFAGGGKFNKVKGPVSGVLGGEKNTTVGDGAVSVGGRSNTASGIMSVVGGGENITVMEDGGWAAGERGGSKSKRYSPSRVPSQLPSIEGIG